MINHVWLSHWLHDDSVCDLLSNSRGFDSCLGCYQVTSLGKLFVHMCFSLPTSIVWYGQSSVIHCSWEGNRRFGVALAMCQWFIPLWAQWQRFIVQLILFTSVISHSELHYTSTQKTCMHAIGSNLVMWHWQIRTVARTRGQQFTQPTVKWTVALWCG